MASASPLVIRPRSAGEILDEACELYRAELPLLLVLSALFHAPALTALLLLVTLPAPESVFLRIAWPVAAGLLLTMTGLGSGASQEALRRLADAEKPQGLACVRATLRRGLDHAAARGLVLCGTVLGGFCLLVPGLAVWASGAAVHAVLAGGDERLFAALATSRREAQRQPLKTAAVVLTRLPLLAVVVLNLHVVFAVALWIAEHLAGFDVAVVSVVAALDNPAYLLVLSLLAWLLLAPLFEAANFLLHADGRARFEGLDLWYRVRRQFGAAAALLLAAWLLTHGRAAADEPAAVVQEARRDVKAMTREVREAEPYPGSGRWLPRLREVVGRLEASEGKAASYRWYRDALAGFEHRSRAGALHVLAGLDERLGLVEESLAARVEADGPRRPKLTKEEMKHLLPATTEDEEEVQRKRAEAKMRERPAERQRVRRDDSGPARDESRGPGVLSPQPGGGFSALGWTLLAGAAVAVVLLALIWGRRQPQAPKKSVAVEADALERPLERPDRQSVDDLWQRAEELARAGNYRDGVRVLYLAVLAVLHRANLIRFEPTRTNGEYVRQLRPRADLGQPFRDLTRRFEQQLYGAATSRGEDFDVCRGLAVAIRDVVQNG